MIRPRPASNSATGSGYEPRGASRLDNFRYSLGLEEGGGENHQGTIETTAVASV
jgi:hypothetical protein